MDAYGVFCNDELCFDENSCAVYVLRRFAEFKKAKLATLYPGVDYAIKEIKIEVIE